MTLASPQLPRPLQSQPDTSPRSLRDCHRHIQQRHATFKAPGDRYPLRSRIFRPRRLQFLHRSIHQPLLPLRSLPLIAPAHKPLQSARASPNIWAPPLRNKTSFQRWCHPDASPIDTPNPPSKYSSRSPQSDNTLNGRPHQATCNR